MASDSDEAMALFEVRPADQDGWVGGGGGDGYGDDPPFIPAARRNMFALVGAGLSFVPLVGLGLSAVGYRRSKTRRGSGRTVALVGIGLSLVFGGAEIYVGMTAPMFDAGCQSAKSSGSLLQAIQTSPGSDVSALVGEMTAIHAELDTAAGAAGDAQVRARLQLVADDVKLVGADLKAMQQTGDTSRLFADESKLQVDGGAANSYCGSL